MSPAQEDPVKAFVGGVIIACVLAAATLFIYSSFAIDSAGGYRPAATTHLD
ncbi:hypothetical protein [Aquibaculum arenosum]|uniref:Uncharacterized protein n=1 Tax=Aquibaculum arenosum TaxID=3032591 RepID=A0ABT5YPE1_9PROT|nr:hypothetical protein [Fodinicurvata sp. CAU 1616]MDF2096826.1 hypothetical protein [Fodinicurvata sp. CAU 1616]